MTQSEWLLQPLFTGAFVVLGIILLYQLIIRSVIQYFNLRETKLNYSVGWLNFFSVNYFGLLGIYFEYEASHLGRDVEFVDFRLLLLFFVVIYLSRKASFAIAVVNALARIVFWGWSIGTMGYLGFGLTMYLIAIGISIYVAKHKLPPISIILFYDALTAIFWIFFHYYKWLNFGEVSWSQAIFYWGSFFIMNMLLYYGLNSLNDENDYLVSVTHRATTDPLTNLKNYAVFKADFEKWFDTFEEKHNPITMMQLILTISNELMISMGIWLGCGLDSAGNAAEAGTNGV
ncbi:hypothetical protein C5L31_001170 [Secundilactobacillus malefermentans]|uniref:Uncharacterized protein n=1 Tax=Secundilactobacillus malefermentans TaxID=176292 RepID=A0A4R5NH84_9LACO|nr:hypothetical protein [Secundilactobacillus malefermentans]KRM57552.1 hypothetical protein FD44_GL001110 [Secundilactobacillus malefermentans DSM 5705 = KCTC 3548]TDG73906.1 hypothetical protein C5L31_001170 [Secundilactobacillus malefermentans]